MQSTRPTSTLNATSTTKPVPTGSNNLVLIVGIAVGAAVLLVICFVVICVVRKRRRRRPVSTDTDTRKKSQEKPDGATADLMKELGTRKKLNKYVTSFKKNKMEESADGRETGYVTLSQTEGVAPLSQKAEVAPIKVAIMPKPKPKPKPRQLQSTSAENVDPEVESSTKRKPLPAPRSKPLEKKGKICSAGDTREAENKLYDSPDLLQEENEIYLEPKANQPSNVIGNKLNIKKAQPGTSAKLFNNSAAVSGCNENDDQNFAMYVPVGQTETIYKIPSNQQRFDPPSRPPGNVMHEIYTPMGDDEYEDVSQIPNYEDVNAVTNTINYEDMGNITPNTYQCLPEGDSDQSDNEYEVYNI